MSTLAFTRLIVVAVAIAAVFAVAIWSAVGAVLRRLERSRWAFERARRATSVTSARSPGARTALVVLASLGAIVPLQVWCRVSPSSATTEPAVLAGVLVAVLVVVALHRLPATLRTAKYFLVLTALLAWWVTTLARLVSIERNQEGALRGSTKILAEICSGNTLVDRYLRLEHVAADEFRRFPVLERQPLWWPGFGAWTLLIPSLFAVAIAAIYVWWNRAQARSAPTYQLVIRSGRYVFLVCGAVIAFGEVSAFDRHLWVLHCGIAALVAYCIARLHVIEAMIEAPIVYVRSFANPGGPVLFGRAIAPAMSTFGVIVGLVHEDQPSGELFAVAHPTTRGRFFACSNADWRGWVERRLKTASYVIADATTASASVAWEVEVARRYLPPDRILTIESLPDGATWDRTHLALLRSRLRAWMSGQPDRGRRGPAGVLVLALVAVVASLSAPARGASYRERRRGKRCVNPT